MEYSLENYKTIYYQLINIFKTDFSNDYSENEINCDAAFPKEAELNLYLVKNAVYNLLAILCKKTIDQFLDIYDWKNTIINKLHVNYQLFEALNF